MIDYWDLSEKERAALTSREMRLRGYVLANDPGFPRHRTFVDCDERTPTLLDVVFAQFTSDRPDAEITEVHDRVILTRAEAGWLRDELTKWMAEYDADLAPATDLETALRRSTEAGANDR